MGDTKDVLMEIEKLSEIKPNVLDAKGILIATFSSAVEPSELQSFFKLNNRSFLLFDLNPKVSGYHIAKEGIHEGLFGFIKTLDDDALKNKANDLIIEITSSSETQSRPTHVKTKINSLRDFVSEADVDKMTKTEKKKLADKIIDKGFEKLTDHDKKLLKKLAI